MNNEKIDMIQQHILEVINSGEVYKTLETISNKYNLHIDQLGQLNMDTEKVLIGQLAPESFVKTISANLEIPVETAKKITTDINAEVIMKVRQNLQEKTTEKTIENTQPAPQTQRPTPLPQPRPQPIQPAPAIQTPYTKPPETPQPHPTISAIEKAGGFTIEKNSQNFSSLYNLTVQPKPQIVVDEIEKEHPVPDLTHLLAKPEAAPAPTQPPIQKPAPKPVERKPYTVDPYREPI